MALNEYLDREQMESLTRSKQIEALRRLIVELKRDIDAVEAKIGKLEDQHERLVAQRNQALGRVARLENSPKE